MLEVGVCYKCSCGEEVCLSGGKRSLEEQVSEARLGWIFIDGQSFCLKNSECRKKFKTTLFNLLNRSQASGVEMNTFFFFPSLKKEALRCLCGAGVFFLGENISLKEQIQEAQTEWIAVGDHVFCLKDQYCRKKFKSALFKYLEENLSYVDYETFWLDSNGG